jgi:hypothetical protein
MTFIVTIQIWSGWKWAEWMVIFATATHSQILNRVHTELKPYQPSSICIVTRVNSWGFLGLRYGWKKHYGYVKKNLLVSNRIEIRFKSFSTPFDQYRPECKTLSQLIAWRTIQYTTRVNAVLHCGLMRVSAIRTRTMRFELGQYGYEYRIEIRVNILNMTKTFFVLSESIRNWHGLRCKSIRVEPCRYGFLIPYGPGSKSGCVWLHSRNADLIVNCFDPFQPVWTCI